MSWPETNPEDILKALDLIRAIVENLRPGQWCDEECASALHEIAAAARKAKVMVYNKTNVKPEPIE